MTNVAELRRLEFIPREFGLPLTLLVSYQVARDPAACQVLARWRDLYRAEIGVHLHPWSTPPFADLNWPEPVPSEQLPLPLLRDKFAHLVQAVQDFPGGHGRRLSAWAASISAPRCCGLLPEFGLQVDSSIVPLTLKGAGAYFLAPAEPFPLLPPDLTGSPPDPGAGGGESAPGPGPAGPALASGLGPPPAEPVQILGRRRYAAGLVSSGLHAPGRRPAPPPGRPGAHPVLPLFGA